MEQDRTSTFNVSIGTEIHGSMVLSGDEVIQLYFVEDIFSFCMNGKLTMTDTRGMFEFGPITGNETIKIVYSSGEGESENKEWEFKIYKVSRIEQLNTGSPDTEEAIEIFFTDYMFFSLNFFRYSKAWKDKHIHEIVRDIGNNWLYAESHPQGWNEFEETNERLDYFYMPLWYPSTALSWLMKRGTGVEQNEAGYLFYNAVNGVNFVTLGKLLNNPFMQTPGLGENAEEYVFQDANPQYFNKIMNWSISGLDMIGLKFLSGSTKYGIDSMNKKFIKNEYKYSDMLEKHTLLGRSSLFPDIDNEISSFDIVGTKSDEIDAIYGNSWNKRYDLQHCFSMVVRGHEARYPGGMIKVKWDSIDKEEQGFNKHLDGNYLVKSITHIFTGHSDMSYKQKMVCIKNAYYESDVSALVSSIKNRP